LNPAVDPGVKAVKSVPGTSREKRGTKPVHSDANYTIRVKGDRHHLESTMDLVQFAAMEFGVEESQADIIASAVGEACQNAVHYSFREPDQVVFDLEIRLGEQEVTAIVTNRGPAFEFDAISPFRRDHDFMLYETGGMGIPMMKKLMDDATYERRPDDVNVVILKKRIQRNTSGEGEEYYED